MFGRNTIGGAVSVITRQPKTVYAFSGKARMGNLVQQELRFSADIPLTDKWLSQIAISSIRRDGYQQRVPFITESRYLTDLDMSNKPCAIVSH